MQRRHLFDHGYPVTTPTLLAGSEVLLAIARQSLRQSSLKLARSLLRLAESSQRLIDAVARCGCSHAEPRESRDNYAYRACPGQPSERATGIEPLHRAARAQPHHR